MSLKMDKERNKDFSLVIIGAVYLMPYKQDKGNQYYDNQYYVIAEAKSSAVDEDGHHYYSGYVLYNKGQKEFDFSPIVIRENKLREYVGDIEPYKNGYGYRNRVEYYTEKFINLRPEYFI